MIRIDQARPQADTVYINIRQNPKILTALKIPKFNDFCVPKLVDSKAFRLSGQQLLFVTATSQLWSIYTLYSDRHAMANDWRPTIDVHTKSVGVINRGHI